MRSWVYQKISLFFTARLYIHNISFQESLQHALQARGGAPTAAALVFWVFFQRPVNRPASTAAHGEEPMGEVDGSTLTCPSKEAVCNRLHVLQAG